MPRTSQTTKTDFPAANTAAVVVLPAMLNRRWRIIRILASYSAAPTGGRVQVVSDQAPLPDLSDPAAKTVLDLDVIAGGPLGPGHLPDQGMCMPDGNAACTITLAAAGAAVVGKLTVIAEPE